MKKFIIPVLILALIICGYFAYRFLTASPTPTGTTSPVTLPTGTTIGSTLPSGGTEPAGQISVPTQGTANVQIKDFIHNGETVADIENPGSYVLAGSLGYCLADGSCPKGFASDEFTVSYNGTLGEFNVSLIKEPIGLSRTDAEQFLESRLGLTAAQLCTLKYFVGTPYWVNETYDNRNLGFSSCQGATPLPD